MILAIEGPDCCGKSTLVELLKPHFPRAVFCGGLPLPSPLMPVMSYVEVRQEALWRQLYDPQKLYIADRSFTVSAQVYSRYFKRPLLFDPTPWIREQFIVYINVPTRVLESRMRERGDEHVAVESSYELRSLYFDVLMDYTRVIVDGNQLQNHLLEEVLCLISSSGIVPGGVQTTLDRLRSFRH
jgi:thymidylate kinase